MTDPVPPEVIAIALALAATLSEEGSRPTSPALPDIGAWRWEAWGSDGRDP